MGDDTLRKRINAYLDSHEWPTEDEIAEALGANVVDVLNELVKMEKKGELVSKEA